jgi:hypothetical protein
MRRPHLEQAFNQRFQWYEDNREAGSYYPAILALAELEDCLEALPKNVQASWRKRINGEPLTGEVVRGVEAGIAEALETVRRIISVGNRWCFEEFSLVLGKMTEVELVLRFLQQRGLLTRHLFPLDELEADLLEIAGSKGNKQDFRMAVTLNKRNWGLPINSRWLGDELIRM